eukprot:1161833-Pelagomonas_calceolata.AAC.5
MADVEASVLYVSVLCLWMLGGYLAVARCNQRAYEVHPVVWPLPSCKNAMRLAFKRMLIHGMRHLTAPLAAASATSWGSVRAQGFWIQSKNRGVWLQPEIILGGVDMVMAVSASRERESHGHGNVYGCKQGEPGRETGAYSWPWL